MIRNRSIPLRVPPHWVNIDSDEELRRKIALRDKFSGEKEKLQKILFDPKSFIDPKLLHKGLKSTSWSIEYLNFLVKEGEYELVSSAGGRIESILLVINPPKGEIESQTHVYKTLIYSLGPNRIYHILCASDVEDSIKGWLKPLDGKNIKVNFYHSVFNVTCWAQDPYVALYSQKFKNTILAESNDFNRFDDQTIACDVGAQSKSIFDFPSYYYLQGGNILNALDYVLIGKDYVVKNTGRAFLRGEKKVLNSFSGLFNGKKCLSIGLPKAIPNSRRTPPQMDNCVTALSYSGIWQPVFHIDMFITTTGIRSSKKGNREFLLVGSLEEAQKALSEFPRSDEMTRFKQYCKIYAQYFEGISKQLEKYFEVIRIPVYPGKAKFSYGGVEYKADYYLTYNNAVIESFIENGEDKKNVYMPNYTLSSEDDPLDPDPGINKELNNIRICLDLYATNVWKDLGFKVYPINRMELLAQSAGAIHCMTKILTRNTSFIQTKLIP